jgi:hypothetical protein
MNKLSKVKSLIILENKNSIEDEKSQENISLGWTKKNVRTLYHWLLTASFNINALERTITLYRKIVRKSTIFGLIVSTLSGTISATQINQNTEQYVKLSLNALFTILSFSITICTGYIKIYRIQEQLEEFIRLKQEWVVLSTSIISEIQLPLVMRQPAFEIIKNNKNKYLDLLKIDIDIPENILNDTQEYMKQYTDNIPSGVKNTLTDIILTVGKHENKIHENNDDEEENYDIENPEIKKKHDDIDNIEFELEENCDEYNEEEIKEITESVSNFRFC